MFFGKDAPAEPAEGANSMDDVRYMAPRGSGEPVEAARCAAEPGTSGRCAAASGEAGLDPAGRNAAEPGKAGQEDFDRDRYEPTVAEEIRTLILKILYVLIAFFIVFTFIFGLHRNLSAGMQPSLRDGDLLFYYRLDRDFRANNVVVFEYKDEMIASRVIAVEGDTVDITDNGLEINGHLIYEPEIYSRTTQFKDGPTFPLTVEPGTVFVLGDNREHANDSRIIGLVKNKDIKGKVMGVIRRRNL